MISIDLFWKFFAGIGIFLFGLSSLEESLKFASSDTLSKRLKQYTKTPARGIVFGTVVTAILQSSGVVTLMLLAFVGAGLMGLSHAFGVILGANLGTTFTGWIVSFIGFKVDLDVFIYPLIAIGALGRLIFEDRQKIRYTFQFIFGFSFLLFGLNMMKSSMEGVATSFDVSLLRDYSLVTYLVFGFIFTALINSSSATMMITLTALDSGILEMRGAAALIIGADIGSTMTTVIGSFNGGNAKKQIAGAHVIFNLFVDLIAFAFLPYLLILSAYISPIKSDITQLVTLHSTMNFLGIFIFYPFIAFFSKKLEKIFPVKQRSFDDLIENIKPEFIDATLQALIIRIGDKTKVVYQFIEGQLSGKPDVNHVYRDLKILFERLLGQIIKIQSLQISEEESRTAQRLLSVIDHYTYAIKFAKDTNTNLVEAKRMFDDDDKRFFDKFKADFEVISQKSQELVDENNQELFFEMAHQLHKFIKNYQLSLIKDVYHLIKNESQANDYLNISKLNLVKEASNSYQEFLKGLSCLKLGQEKSKDLIGILAE